MQRIKQSYAIAPTQCDIIKLRMLNWSKQFSILIFLDSNNYATQYSKYECMLAAGARYVIDVAYGLDAVNEYHTAKKDWLFGHISYDYKNSLESRLVSNHPDNVGFPSLYFFQPETVCYISTAKNELVIETISGNPDNIYQQIMEADVVQTTSVPTVQFLQRTTRDKYLDTVNQLREHIRNGDCYEINYCNENYAEGIALNPLQVFLKLNAISRAPFAAYYRNDDKYLICASPERYVCKNGSDIISQPIKGTARRGADEEQDNATKEALYNSIKDRAENVMITDLVRNDLARSCETGSIKVNELYGIYTFPQVHQMISTITGTLKQGTPFTDVLKYSFPMGSMTGAPKVKVMQLVEQYEDVSRGLYSGTVGYITPSGDFDFNVVIRSLFYNEATQYLSYQAGGAITYDSTAEAEWDEMRLKAWAMERIFSGTATG